MIAGSAFGDMITLSWPQRACPNGREARTKGTPLIQINWPISIRANAGRPNIRWYRAPICQHRLKERSIAFTLDLYIRLCSRWRWMRLSGLLIIVSPPNLRISLLKNLEWFDIKLGLVPYKNHLELILSHSCPLQLPEQCLPSKLEEQRQDPYWLRCWLQRPSSQSGNGSGSCGANQSTKTGVEGIQSQRLDIDVCQSTKTGIRKQAARSLLTVH